MIGTRRTAIITIRHLMLVTLGVGFSGHCWGEEPSSGKSSPVTSQPAGKTAASATEKAAKEKASTAKEPAPEPMEPAPSRKLPPFRKLTNVEYARHGKVSLLADLFIPKDQGVFPGVLVVHGGAWRHGSKERCAAVAAELVQRGYSVMTINYRLAPQHKFPAQLEDCVAALGWLHQHAHQYKVDPSRIGAWGYSAGGQLVALLGATRPSERAGNNGVDDAANDGAAANGAAANGGAADGEDNEAQENATGGNAARGGKMLKKKGQAAADVRLRAVVAGGAPTDFRNWLPPESTMLAYWLGKTRAERPDLYRLASPRHFSSKDDPPMFFFHGENDAIVPARFGRAMATDLAELGVQAVFHLVPSKGHVLARFDETAMLASFAFLDKHLKGLEEVDEPPADRQRKPAAKNTTNALPTKR